MTNDVRTRRAEHGISQGDLGAALGVSRQTINAIETGRYLPSLPLAFALARFFGASVEEIFRPESGGNDPRALGRAERLRQNRVLVRRG